MFRTLPESHTPGGLFLQLAQQRKPRPARGGSSTPPFSRCWPRPGHLEHALVRTDTPGEPKRILSGTWLLQPRKQISSVLFQCKSGAKKSNQGGLARLNFAVSQGQWQRAVFFEGYRNNEANRIPARLEANKTVLKRKVGKSFVLELLSLAWVLLKVGGDSVLATLFLHPPFLKRELADVLSPALPDPKGRVITL